MPSRTVKFDCTGCGKTIDVDERSFDLAHKLKLDIEFYCDNCKEE